MQPFIRHTTGFAQRITPSSVLLGLLREAEALQQSGEAPSTTPYLAFQQQKGDRIPAISTDPEDTYMYPLDRISVSTEDDLLVHQQGEGAEAILAFHRIDSMIHVRIEWH